MARVKVPMKSIKVPAPVHKLIEELAQRLNMHMYQVVERAVYLLDNITRNPVRKKNLPRLDKASWYIFKLVTTITMFKVNPSKEQAERTLAVLEDIQNRLGVDTTMLRRQVELYTGSKELTKEQIIELNELTKHAIADIIVKMLFEGEERVEGVVHEI